MIEFNDEQKAIANKLQFKMEMHMTLEKEGILQHGCDYMGMHITKVVSTPRKRGVWGKGIQSFYIDKEKTEYKTPHALLDELIKRTLKVTP